MADYERRLQRLEEQATIVDDRGASLMEAIRKRSDELTASEEMQAWLRDNPQPDISKEELAAWVEAICNRAYAESRRPGLKE